MSDFPLGKDYYLEVSKSIKSVYDLTARIVERVKLLMSKQDDTQRKLDEHMTRVSDLDGRIMVIESKNGEAAIKQLGMLRDDFHKLEGRIQVVEISSAGNEGKWKIIIDFGVKILWIIVGSYALLKLGLN